jgi:hypothetical protein
LKACCHPGFELLPVWAVIYPFPWRCIDQDFALLRAMPCPIETLGSQNEIKYDQEIAEMLKPARIVVLLPLLLVACDGTFPLFSAVDAPPGTSAKQQQSDIVLCSTDAESQASKSGERVKAFFSQSARDDDKALQRKLFAACMSTKGYTVVPVQANAQAPQTSPANAG